MRKLTTPVIHGVKMALIMRRTHHTVVLWDRSRKSSHAVLSFTFYRHKQYVHISVGNNYVSYSFVLLNEAGDIVPRSP